MMALQSLLLILFLTGRNSAEDDVLTKGQLTSRSQTFSSLTLKSELPLQEGDKDALLTREKDIKKVADIHSEADCKAEACGFSEVPESDISIVDHSPSRAKNCNHLPDLQNGRIEYEGGTTFGSVARFYCNEGYNIVGRNYTNCLADGWDHQKPTCVPVKCEEPPSIKGGQYQLASTSYDIEFGTVATYMCNMGQLVGEKTIHCTKSGTWSGPPPSCKDECDWPPRLTTKNAIPIYGTRTTFPVGAKVTYKCHTGYFGKPGTKNSIICQQDLTWTELQIICLPRDCRPLPDIQNGRIDYEGGTTFGSVARFYCDEGYNIFGRNYRNCLTNGWDFQNPTCEPVFCEEPPSVPNGVYDIGSTGDHEIQFGTVVTYRCRKGQLIGEKSIHCTSSGTWSGPPPSCRDIVCQDPYITNGQKIANFGIKYTYHDSVTFKCNTGYSMIGSSSVTCNEDGIWVPTLPTCEPKDCGLLPTIENGHIEYTDGTTFGSLAHFYCKEGYKIDGRNYRKCLDDGWNYNNPTCVRITCYNPQVKNGIQMSGTASAYFYKDWITFECEPEFTMKGSNNITCTERGTWAPEVPKCISAVCDAVNTRKNFYQCGMSMDEWKSFLEVEKLYLEVHKLQLELKQPNITTAGKLLELIHSALKDENLV